MARWAAFAGITVAVLSLLLVLARASQAVVSREADAEDRARSDDERVRSDTSAGRDRPGVPHSRYVRYGPVHRERVPVDADDTPDGGEGDAGEGADGGRVAAPTAPATAADDGGPSTSLLLVNVALSQGLFGTLLIAGAWYAEVPPAALGLSGPLAPAVALGAAVGLALSAANTLSGLVVRRLGFAPSDELRSLLAPETPAGWLMLLGGVLPLVAGFEELLFRGALVGGFAAGFGVSPWALAVLSSVAFALGHGAQGPAGVAVTGLLGLALAAVFVLTGSLVVVVVAHYLVNALEFVVHEGLGAELAGG